MHPKIVVVISANIEWQVVKSFFPTVECHASPYGEWFQTDTTALIKSVNSQISDPPIPITFFHQGWGKIAAAGGTQYVIDRWQPNILFNLGTCGGFAGEIERYAVILAEKTLVYDIIEQMGDFDEHIAHYTSEIDLSWLGDQQTYPQEVIQTLLVSADRDLIVGEIPELKEKYGAVAGDWESGAIAWVAARNQVRCLILRGVSDLVGDNGGEAYEGNIDLFVEGTRVVMTQLLASLPNWICLAASVTP